MFRQPSRVFGRWCRGLSRPCQRSGLPLRRVPGGAGEVDRAGSYSPAAERRAGVVALEGAADRSLEELAVVSHIGTSQNHVVAGEPFVNVVTVVPTTISAFAVPVASNRFNPAPDSAVRSRLVSI